MDIKEIAMKIGQHLAKAEQRVAEACSAYMLNRR